MIKDSTRMTVAAEHAERSPGKGLCVLGGLGGVVFQALAIQ
jgi:hypothetical protein